MEKVLNFRDKYVASIDEAISDERNEITKRNLEAKRELIYKQYTDLSDKLFERDLTTNTRNIYYNTLLAHLKSKFNSAPSFNSASFIFYQVIIAFILIFNCCAIINSWSIGHFAILN